MTNKYLAAVSHPGAISQTFSMSSNGQLTRRQEEAQENYTEDGLELEIMTRKGYQAMDNLGQLTVGAVDNMAFVLNGINAIRQGSQGSGWVKNELNDFCQGAAATCGEGLVRLLQVETMEQGRIATRPCLPPREPPKKGIFRR